METLEQMRQAFFNEGKRKRAIERELGQLRHAIDRALATGEAGRSYTTSTTARHLGLEN